MKKSLSKLREGNVFSCVFLSFCWAGFHSTGPQLRSPSVRTLAHPQTCSNLFNLDLTVQVPTPLDMFNLVQYKTRTVDKRAVDMLLNDFLFLFVTVKEKDLTLFAEEIRVYTKQAMKIEVAPWIRDYVVDMEELYSELTLEKIQNKAYGPDGRVLGHYREMFGDLRESKSEDEKKNQIPRQAGSGSSCK